jgi:hypothetical protein
LAITSVSELGAKIGSWDAAKIEGRVLTIAAELEQGRAPAEIASARTFIADEKRVASDRTSDGNRRRVLFILSIYQIRLTKDKWKRK